jgi:hypothetical protein
MVHRLVDHILIPRVAMNNKTLKIAFNEKNNNAKIVNDFLKEGNKKFNKNSL